VFSAYCLLVFYVRERLQKLISEAGIDSRRHAEDLIKAGQVSVNGQTVTTLGVKADPDLDHIKVRGRLINPTLSQRKKIYILLNKPKGFLTSLADQEGRPLVAQLIPATLGRLHPVGRLDFNSEGLLILTNDGDFTNRIASAKNRVPKVYKIKVKGKPSESQIEHLRRGVSIGQGERTAPAEIERLRESESNSWFEIVLHEGRNQQIRRMFDAIGHSVLKLQRTRIGSVTGRSLQAGEWRRLTEKEVGALKRSVSVSSTRPKQRTRHL